MHFCVDMGRALFTPFSHRHAKVRMAGLKCLYNVMTCGLWKTSADLLASMIGFRDPNIVPIKDFYEPSTKLNYFALFVADRSTVCRELFYKTMGLLLTKLPDKYDHEGRLYPYILSGLYDANDGIRSTVFEIIEEIGQIHEEENEEKLRETKQYAYTNEWTLNGQIKDSQMVYPFPILHRPRLGSRIVTRSYVRRYIRGLYGEMNDWIEVNRLRCSQLLLYSTMYAEDYMTQFLDELLVAIYRNIIDKENKIIHENISKTIKLLGRYCKPIGY